MEAKYSIFIVHILLDIIIYFLIFLFYTYIVIVYIINLRAHFRK